jgi:hypothetical protein
MTWQHVSVDWHSMDRADTATQTGAHGRKLWKYGWGLLFVAAMTLLSEFGPPTLYTKLPPAPSVASQPVVHTIK